jgi:hypothetical protein
MPEGKGAVARAANDCCFSAGLMTLGSGTSPVVAMNWFRSVGNTVTVTRMGVRVWSKAVLKTSKTATRPSPGRLKNRAS